MQKIDFQKDKSYFRCFSKFVMQGEKAAARGYLAHNKNKISFFRKFLLIISFLAIKKISKGLNLYVFFENPRFFSKILGGFTQKKALKFEGKKLFSDYLF